MKKLLKPYWLIVVVTIPQTILLTVFYRSFSRMQSELFAEEVRFGIIFGAALAVLVLTITGYAIWKLINNKPVIKLDVIGIMIAYFIYLYALIYFFDEVIFFVAPDWMFLGLEPLLLITGLFMPVPLYCILSSAVLLMPEKGYKLWLDIVLVVGIPLVYYALFSLDVFWYFSSVMLEHLMIVLLIAASIVFVFFAVRIIYHLLYRKMKSWLVVTLLAGLILPLGGLILNQTFAESFFGDFSHPLFYTVAGVTGVVLVLPELKDIRFRWAVFIAKCICYAYTLYFFIVFLPILPFSFVLIIAFGIGLLLMAPTFLLIVHTRSLMSDYASLKAHYGTHSINRVLTAVLIGGVLLLPLGITGAALKDKANINHALEYLYEAGYDDLAQTTVNERALSQTIENIEKNSETGDWKAYNGTPYISNYYNWVVSDHASLSDENTALIRAVFLGEQLSGEQIEEDDFRGFSGAWADSPEVKIKQYVTTTAYDAEKGYFTSWVHLELENSDGWNNQYLTQFSLPSGCYISDYYLFVDDEKKQGLITDKRAANWIYEKIVNVRRDPGILTYLDNGDISLRVFPFSEGEIRKTGIAFAHTEPVTLQIDGINIVLGAEETKRQSISIEPGITYLPAAAKAALPKVEREPAYYFVIDCSKNSEDEVRAYIGRIERFMEDNGIQTNEVDYYLANYNIKTAPGTIDQESLQSRMECEGGFYVDRAMKHIFFENHMRGSETCPVIIIVTNDFDQAIISDDYDSLRFTFPDSEYIYQIDKYAQLYSYSLLTQETKASSFESIQTDRQDVHVYTDETGAHRYLVDDGQGAVVTGEALDVDLTEVLGENPWEDGVILEALDRALELRNGDVNSIRLEMVRGSIVSRVMTPLSAYIVLETEAQEQVLLKKQEQLLNADKQYLSETEEAPMDMPEPSLWAMLALLALFMLYKGYRKASAENSENAQ